MWIIRIISSLILLIPINGQIIHIIHIYFLIKTLKPMWIIKIISSTNILNSSLSDIIRVHIRISVSIRAIRVHQCHPWEKIKTAPCIIHEAVILCLRVNCLMVKG